MNQKHKINNKELYEFFEQYKDLLGIEGTANSYNAKYQTNYTKRTLQQRYQHYKDGLNDGIKVMSSKEDRNNLLAKQTLKLMEERKYNLELRKEANKISLANSKRKLLVEDIKEMIDSKLSNVVIQPPKHWEDITVNTKLDKENCTIIFGISDLHYSGEQDDQFVKLMFDNLKTLVHDTLTNFPYSKAPKNVKVVFADLGDTIEGSYAHLSQLPLSKQLGVEQAIGIATLYTKHFNEIFNEIKELHSGRVTSIDFVFVDKSNHSQIRTQGTSRSEFAKEDLGMIIGHYLKSTIDKEVNLYLTGDDGVIEADYGYFIHGHQKWASNAKSLKDKLWLGKTIKPIFMGHYHNFKISHDGKGTIVVFGALKPTERNYEVDNNYSQAIGLQSVIISDGMISANLHKIEGWK